MHTPKQINIQDFTYHLPEEKIAKYPLEKRDESKLLVYKDAQIKERIFKDITEELPEHGLLVFNNTKVIHARMLFQRQTGAQIEVFCIEPAQGADYQLTFASKQSCQWKCMVGNAKRWKEDVLTKLVIVNGVEVELRAEKTGRAGDLFEVYFTWDTDVTFAELLHYAGVLPLPPYLNRNSEVGDEQTYQTIYAKHEGSVAAPTAGLHFTDEVLAQLHTKNITTAEVTLHVGAGTFKPIKAETLAEHDMHEESIYIPIEILQRISHQLQSNNTIIAVGTTSTRTLESLYWHGVKVIKGFAEGACYIKQWDAYELDASNISAAMAIEAIITHLTKQQLEVLHGSTQIIIAPGYTFKMVDVLVTNFHQPENSLILLIAAFVGTDWCNIYEYALKHDFRFLSYGDSSVLFR
jgi:S-adenosylmethionine:tRNA ribosyltransferase-isomerase